MSGSRKERRCRQDDFAKDALFAAICLPYISPISPILREKITYVSDMRTHIHSVAIAIDTSSITD